MYIFYKQNFDSIINSLLNAKQVESSAALAVSWKESYWPDRGNLTLFVSLLRSLFNYVMFVIKQSTTISAFPRKHFIIKTSSVNTTTTIITMSTCAAYYDRRKRCTFIEAINELDPSPTEP